MARTDADWTAETFVRRASERGLDVEVRRFPEDTRTATAAADALGVDAGQVARSLAFRVGADGALVVVVAGGAARVDEAKLAAHVGVEPETVLLADPDAVAEALGWPVGAVPPACHATPVPVVLDAELLAFDRVWAGAGAADALFDAAPETLRDVADASVAGVTED